MIINELSREEKDGGRFIFKKENNFTIMADTLNVLPNVQLPDTVAEVLSIILWNHHEYREREESQLNGVYGLFKVMEDFPDVDKDVAMTIIKFGGDYNK